VSVPGPLTACGKQAPAMAPLSNLRRCRNIASEVISDGLMSDWLTNQHVSSALWRRVASD